MPLVQPGARHDAGANELVLRSRDNTKCGNRFHDQKDYSMEGR
jgi:hypothetical protein